MRTVTATAEWNSRTTGSSTKTLLQETGRPLRKLGDSCCKAYYQEDWMFYDSSNSTSAAASTAAAHLAWLGGHIAAHRAAQKMLCAGGGTRNCRQATRGQQTKRMAGADRTQLKKRPLTSTAVAALAQAASAGVAVREHAAPVARTGCERTAAATTGMCVGEREAPTLLAGPRELQLRIWSARGWPGGCGAA